MPLTIEAEVMNAQHMREEDERFKAKFGEAKWKEKMENEGSVAYRYLNELYKELAVDLSFTLSEEYLHGDNQALKQKYFNERAHHKWFNFEFWGMANARGEVINFDNTFPRQEFEARMKALMLPYGLVPNYRAAELSETEIRRFNGGTFDGYRYLDLSEVLRPLQKPDLDEGQLGDNFSQDTVYVPRPRPLKGKSRQIADAIGRVIAKQENSVFPDLIVGSKVMSSQNLLEEINSGSEIGDRQLELVEGFIDERSHLKFGQIIKMLSKGSRF